MKKCFTLIEAVVAISILGIGVLALAGFFVASAQTTRIARHTTTAANLAQGLIDQEMAKSYDELTPGTGSKIKVSTDPANPFYIYEKQINITLIDSNLAISPTDLGLKKIDVWVFWQEGSIQKNVQISSIKSKR